MPPCALAIQLTSQEVKVFSPNSFSLLQELFRGTVAWQDLSVPLPQCCDHATVGAQTSLVPRIS